MKNSTHREKISEIFDWILINIIIVISVPVAKLILLIVAEETIDMVSLMSDYSLIAFSIAFNVGAYITDKLQRASYTSTEDLAEDVAEELVRYNRETSASEIIRSFFNALCIALTDESKKRIESTFVDTAEIENKMKRYNKGTYFFAGLCLVFFGALTVIKVKNYLYLLIPLFILSMLLIGCVYIWISLNTNSKTHPVNTINGSPVSEVAFGPEQVAIGETANFVEQNEALQEEVPQEETSQKEVPQKETPQKEVSQEETPQEEAPQKEAPQKEAPQKEAPQKEAPQEEAPQKEIPQKEAPQEETPQGEALQKEVPQKEAPQEETPQGEVSKEKALQEEVFHD